MNHAFLAVLVFLLNTVFSLYIAAVMLRFLLQWVKADFYNPICQFLMKITNPVLIPLRRIIPGFFGLDMAAVVLMLVLELVLVLVLVWLGVLIPGVVPVIVQTVVRLILLVTNVYFFAIIIRAIATWFHHNPYHSHPVLDVLFKLTEPVLRPARRVIPSLAGVDLSPVVVLILLQVINIFISNLIV